MLSERRERERIVMLSSISGARRLRILDLYCCQGGAGMGYHQAGFDVVGVDITPQPRYPFDFIQGDVLAVLRLLLMGAVVGDGEYVLEDFNAAHASPPCQHDSDCQRIQGREHPDLIERTRELLLAAGLPYALENVRGAVPKLREPSMLCGTMFGLEMYRHRYFETSFPITEPMHPPHWAPQVKMGRAPKPGEYIQAVGNFSGVQKAREVMGMPWANRDGLREAIPPAYCEYIGTWLRNHISRGELEEAA